MERRACVVGKPRGKHDFPVDSRAIMDRTTLGPNLRLRPVLLPAPFVTFATVAVASLSCVVSMDCTVGVALRRRRFMDWMECTDVLAVLDRRRFMGWLEDEIELRR